MGSIEELSVMRGKIDEIDSRLSELFLERMKVSTKIAKIKKEGNIAVENRNRELQVIERLTSGREEDEVGYLTALYEKIFEISKDAQRKL